MSPLPPEDVLVARLATVFKARRRDVLVPIGDDVAVVSPGGPVAVTTDVLVEGEDFRDGWDPERLGRKALAVNLSDLAAAGAPPLYALLTLGLPREADPSWLEAFARGFRSVAVDFGVAVVGGDLTRSPVTFVSVTVIGRSPASPLLRSGASPGDELWVSGTLGVAAAGLRARLAGWDLDRQGVARGPAGRLAPERYRVALSRMLRHQLEPRPMVDLGVALAERGLATAAIDISDGLARDLHRLCRASGCGAVVAALYGGEDYGLLFAVSPGRSASVGRLSGRYALRKIGILRENPEIVLAAGPRHEPLPDVGFDHFAEAPGA
ncbi:MAG: thiamine-phosphate kinase [Acidobacteria bacterium ACB2]|nr:thiamine-phosphate kinase [Acidobacteria bacterium ACB2]